jgi:hypothetical protein
MNLISNAKDRGVKEARQAQAEKVQEEKEEKEVTDTRAAFVEEENRIDAKFECTRTNIARFSLLAEKNPDDKDVLRKLQYCHQYLKYLKDEHCDDDGGDFNGPT